jgi:hypothetical protein
LKLWPNVTSDKAYCNRCPHGIELDFPELVMPAINKWLN